MKPNRRLMLAVSALVPLAGCTVVAGVSRTMQGIGGEDASYTLVNLSSQTLESLLCSAPNQPGVVYASNVSQDSNLDMLQYVGLSVGASLHYYPRASGHKIPEKVAVSWRDLPPPGGKAYSGLLHGPFILDVRSRIPAEVLRQVRSDPFVAVLSFGAGKGERALFNWALVDYNPDTFEKKIVQQGGESFQ